MQPLLTGPIGPGWIAIVSPPAHVGARWVWWADSASANGAYGTPRREPHPVDHREPADGGRRGRRAVPDRERPERAPAAKHPHAGAGQVDDDPSPRPPQDERPQAEMHDPAARPHRNEHRRPRPVPCQHRHPQRLAELGRRTDPPEARVQRPAQLRHQVGAAAAGPGRHAPHLRRGGMRRRRHGILEHRRVVVRSRCPGTGRAHTGDHDGRDPDPVPHPDSIRGRSTPGSLRYGPPIRRRVPS